MVSSPPTAEVCELLATCELLALYQISCDTRPGAAEHVKLTVLPIATDIDDGDTAGGTEKQMASVSF